MSFLIAHGADVNLKSNGLRTALYYARRNEFEEIVRVLIERHRFYSITF